MKIRNQELGIRAIIAVVVFVMALGGLGGVVLERYVVPLAARLPILRNYISLDPGAPLVITRREEVRINEGVNHVEVVNAVKNSLVAVYFYEGTLKSPKFRPMAIRTGVIITSDGVVALPAAGLNMQSSVAVLLPGDTLQTATVLGYDNLSEIMFLKVERNNLPIARQGFSRSLSAGEKALLVWRGEGAEQIFVQEARVSSQATPKTGFLNSYELDKWNGNLALDLNLSVAQLGAVVVNRSGELVGMVTTAGNRTFSLRAEDLKLVIDNFLDDRKVIWPQAKLNYLLLSATDAAAMGLPALPGAWLRSGSAGLLANDFIYAVDGRGFAAEFDFQAYLLAKKTGEKVKLKLVRAGAETEIEFSL